MRNYHQLMLRLCYLRAKLREYPPRNAHWIRISCCCFILFWKISYRKKSMDCKYETVISMLRPYFTAGSLLDLGTLLSERNDALLGLIRSQKLFAEVRLLWTVRHCVSNVLQTVSQICTLTSELFREVRSHAQAKANLLVASVLSTEAEGLKAQATELHHSVFEAARKNDATITHLRHIK